MPGLRAILLSLSLCGVAAAERPDASYYGDLARVQEEHGLHREAVLSYRTAIANEGDEEQRWTYREGLAEALAGAGEQAALAALAGEMLASGDPVRAANGDLILADAAQQRGDLPGALARLERVALTSAIASYRQSATRRLAALPGALTAPVLARARARLAGVPADAPALDLALAVAGDVQVRADLLSAACAAAPDDLELLRRCGDALLAAGRNQQARALFAALRHDHPGLAADLDRNLAQVAVASGEPAVAEAAVRSSAAEMPDDVRRSLYLARTFGQLRLWAQAEAEGRIASARSADAGLAMQAAAAMELGDALHHLGRHDEAAVLLRPLAAQQLWPGLRARAQDLLSIRPDGTAAASPVQ